MRHAGLAGIALTFLAFAAGPANADEPSVRWEGLYVGAVAGHLSATTDYENPATPSQTLKGALLGITLGYNLQRGPWVIGAEADVSFGDIDEFVRDGNFLTQDGDLNAFGTVRARVGYSIDKFLPYATAGLMWASLEQGLTCPAGAAFGICSVTGQFDSRSTETFTGWTVGFGGEYEIADHWSLKAEALFGDFDETGYTGTVPVFGTATTQVELDFSHVVRAGVNYRF